MKKIIALILVLSLSLFCFAACKGKNKDNNDNNLPEEKTYSLAIGIDVAQDAAEVTKTVALVVTDANGKIVLCRLDSIALDGTEPTKAFESKAELGDEYGMLTNNDDFGSKLAEWDDQAKAFENYVVGKTAAEVAAIAVNEKGAPTDAALTAGCTISVSDFMSAISKAFESEHKVSFKTSSAFTLGVAVSGSITVENNSAEYAADFAGAVMAGGKVVAAIIDSTSATSAISGTDFGAIEYDGSKLEQGDEYGMLTNSDDFGSKLAEWDDQAKAFANFAVGKTATEVAGISIDSDGKATDLTTSCTIAVSGYKAALEKAISYAR